MNDVAMMPGCAMFPCAEGCGEPMPLQGAMCWQCELYARHYDEAEQKARLAAIYAKREKRMARIAADAHLGAAERDEPRPLELRRGLFTFLGWNAAGDARPARIAAASPDRLVAESELAPECADPARRAESAKRKSELLAKLPRVRAGVRAYAVDRAELWRNEVPICTVAAVVAWDALRTAWWTASDAVCAPAARCLRGRRRLTVLAMCAGAVLAGVAGLIAGRMR